MSDDAAARSGADRAVAVQRDDDILRLIAGGDVAAAFALVMEGYQIKIYRLCIAYLRDPGSAQDVAQDSLVRIWRALPRYDGGASLSTFIYIITRNRCLTAVRARPAGISLSEPAVQAEVDRHFVTDVQAGRDLGRTLRRLVDELPDVTRRIVMLYYFEEGSVAEVSALVGLPEGTVKTHLFRARRRLLSRFEVLGLDNLAIWRQG